LSRSQRLLDLIQVLRRHRRPVSGHMLAGELGISIRTLYRDIATLQGQGADIEGEPGLWLCPEARLHAAAADVFGG
jgi:predicted DNA-binding transcriptional regulator YafY